MKNVRSRLVAVGLALAVNPALAHYYLGARGEALGWAAAYLVSAALLVGSAALGPPSVFAFAMSSLLLVYLLSLARLAKQRAGERPALRGLIALAGLFTLVSGGGALLARAYLVESFRIPSGSMLPSLLPGDSFFVSKLGSPLERGDVVVYRTRGVPPYAKRVVALAGDVVEGTESDLRINHRPIPHSAIDGSCPAPGACRVFEESLGTRKYRILLADDGASSRPFPATRVPQGHVFVMGDNRDNSFDSRHTGPIFHDEVLGKVRFVYWPLSRFGVTPSSY